MDTSQKEAVRTPAIALNMRYLDLNTAAVVYAGSHPNTSTRINCTDVELGISEVESRNSTQKGARGQSPLDGYLPEGGGTYPCSGIMPRALWWPYGTYGTYGRGLCLAGEVPL